MLKIKDNVDLKELEKFGYNFLEFDHIANKPYEYSLYVKDYNKTIADNNSVVVLIKERNVQVCKQANGYYGILDDGLSRMYIQDLIQAGLVEKVD